MRLWRNDRKELPEVDDLLRDLIGHSTVSVKLSYLDKRCQKVVHNVTLVGHTKLLVPGVHAIRLDSGDDLEGICVEVDPCCGLTMSSLCAKLHAGGVHNLQDS